MNSENIVPVGDRGLVLKTLGDMHDFAQLVLKSKLAPRDFTDPASVIIAIQYGAELGLTPMAALQGVAVINGKPSVYGDSALAVCYGTGLVEQFDEFFEGEGDKFKAVCVVRRRGLENPKRVEFSVADAKRAKLWGKSGPWTQYPKRMLQMRARSFALRDSFSDALKGVILAEEAMDYPSDSGGSQAVSEPPKLDLKKGRAKVTVIEAETVPDEPKEEPKKPKDELPVKVGLDDPVLPLPGRRGRKSARRKFEEEIFQIASEKPLTYRELWALGGAIIDADITGLERLEDEDLGFLLKSLREQYGDTPEKKSEPSEPKKPARGGKGGSTRYTGKSAPVRELLDTGYEEFMDQEGVREAMYNWCDHLDDRLQKKYSDVGARKFCERVAEIDPQRLIAAVDFSLEGNYQKLVEPNGRNNHKPNGRNRGPEEYPEPGGSGPAVAD